MRTISTTFTPLDLAKARHWARAFRFACWLDGNDYTYLHGPFRKLLAVGSQPLGQDIEQALGSKHPDAWWFGYLGYDALNKEAGKDQRETFLSFPNHLFFEAETVLEFEENGRVTIHSTDPEAVWLKIESLPSIRPSQEEARNYTFDAGQTRREYLTTIEKTQDLIREGDVYELNHCLFFTSQNHPDGLSFYEDLNLAHPMPFSVWFKGESYEIASASPERYLKKTGSTLASQPIKGTIRRGATPEEDERLRFQLLHSEKERAENMMIVDLVRNDLARVSVTGSTQVEEIFGIYPFPKVFQMISTVVSQLKPELTGLDALVSSFPMGSMTGAPKTEVMKWISRLEPFKRGAFSGALGYFGPGGDFDFNVLIRSYFINHETEQSGFAVGSAITIDAVAAEEWEECKLKAAAILALCGSRLED